MYDDTTRQELREAFRQIVLTLGGIFSLYEPDDSLVWAVTRNLDRVFEAHLGRGSDVDHKARGSSGTRSRPHPAVVELLKSIERLAPEQQEHPRT